jgi:hypothetical protein
MARSIPVLRGLSGLALGELFLLGEAGDVLMGRSRSCAISFQRFRPWLSLSETEQRLRDHFNSAVSRKHLRLTTTGTILTVENLSSTGTTANGQPVITTQSFDLTQAPVSLILGMAPEEFRDTYTDVDGNASQELAELCTGSAMGDVYELPNQAYIENATHWQEKCAATEAYQTLQGRTEWQTIHLWHPWVINQLDSVGDL